MRGSTPATAEETILASGLKLFRFTESSEDKSNATAPSFNPDEFPAVTVPIFVPARSIVYRIDPEGVCREDHLLLRTGSSTRYLVMTLFEFDYD